MLLSLITTAFLMGLAGIPHCAAMCAAPCSLAAPQGISPRVLLGRSLGYALLGALVAMVTQTAVAWSRWSALLQPLWVLVLAGVLAVSLWVAITGQLPQPVADGGVRSFQRLRRWADRGGHGAGTRVRWRPMVLGMTWAALPCGLLYSALVVAALANNGWQGALVMLAFSLPGALVLHQVPRRLRLQGRWLNDPRWALRLSGLLLALASGWGLWQRMLEQWQVWCA